MKVCIIPTIIAFIASFTMNPLHAQESVPGDGANAAGKPRDKKTFESREIIVKDRKDQAEVVTVITDREVKNSTRTDLVNIINQTVPSFYTPNNRLMGFGVAGSGAASMSIRGIGVSGWGPTTGIPFLINGLDTTSSIMGHPIADIFTMKNIDRIEVLHGPQPVLYGSGALGGVVNIITKRRATDGFETELSGAYGSYHSTDDYVMHHGKSGMFDYGISYNYQATDGTRGQRTPNGTSVDSRYFNHNGTARFGLELGSNWYAGANAYAMKMNIHDPGIDGAPTDNLEIFDIMRQGCSLNLMNRYDKASGMIHLFYNQGRHEAERSALGQKSYEQDDALYGGRIVESLKLIPGNTVTAGIDVRRWGGSSKNPSSGMVYVDDKFLRDASLFCMIEQRLFEIITVSAGARHTDNNTFGGHTAWQAGLAILPIEQIKLHGTAAQGFKLPDLRELYVRMFPAEVPNEHLKPELYRSFDAGIGFSLQKKFSFDVTGYRIFSRNKIVKSGPGWDNAGAFNYNGLEATAEYRPVPVIGLNTGYSYIQNEYNNQKLPYTPSDKLLAGINCTAYNAYIGLNAERVHTVYADTAGTKRLSDYWAASVKLGYTFERYRAFVNLNNITDKKYQTYPGYPMPGFNALGGLSVVF